MSRNFLSKTIELLKGDFLISNNGEYKAVFQDDSNFVVYGWKPVWSTDTAGSDAFRLCMQGDCNLVMYSKCEIPKWHTDTHFATVNACCLRLTDDGKLLVYKDCEEVWSSANSKGMKG
ncbi:B-type lectin plumieribetin-like [Tautogolabrus adspersus]